MYHGVRRIVRCQSLVVVVARSRLAAAAAAAAVARLRRTVLVVGVGVVGVFAVDILGFSGVGTGPFVGLAVSVTGLALAVGSALLTTSAATTPPATPPPPVARSTSLLLVVVVVGLGVVGGFLGIVGAAAVITRDRLRGDEQRHVGRALYRGLQHQPGFGFLGRGVRGFLSFRGGGLAGSGSRDRG